MSFYYAWGWLLIPLSYIVSCLLTPASIPCLRRFKMIDHPNERSSHEEPVPRGGGIVILIVFITTFSTLFVFADSDFGQLLLTLLLAGIATAAIGLYDDIKPMPTTFKFSLYAAVVATSIYVLGIPTIPLGSYLIEAQWWVYILEFLVLLWVLNFFNFMDGIDGIAATEAVFIALASCAILAFNTDEHDLVIPLLCIAGASGGFLVWNYPPAEVFMGDVASGFLGLTLALVGVITSIDGSLNIWVWFILYGVFFVDATVTLLRHIARRKSVYIAHRNHAYQRAALVLQNKSRRNPSYNENKNRTIRAHAHRDVSLTVFAINCLWLAPWAFAASLYPTLAVFFTAAALLPLIALVAALGAGSDRPIETSLLR